MPKPSSAFISALRLVRLPNTLTAVADVIAGAAIAGVAPLSPAVLLAALGSGFLYAGGIALNDVLDIEKDRAESPERILPRGLLSSRTAWLIAIGCFGIGLATCFSSPEFNAPHLWTTLGLIGAIVLYDSLPDEPKLPGVLAMGGCRALNLLRGMTLASALSPTLPVVAGLVGHFFLVLFITLISTFEGQVRRDGTRRPYGMTLALVAMPLLYLLPVSAALGSDSVPIILVVGLAGVALGGIVTQPGWQMPPRAIAVVKRAVFLLVLLDALWALACGQYVAAAVLAAFLPVLQWLARALGQRGS